MVETAAAFVTAFEVYVLAGAAFALFFLPRAVTRLDPRVAGAPLALRALIAPGVIALWPMFAWRWVKGTGVPVEWNPHRARAGRMPDPGAPATTREPPR